MGSAGCGMRDFFSNFVRDSRKIPQSRKKIYSINGYESMIWVEKNKNRGGAFIPDDIFCKKLITIGFVGNVKFVHNSGP
jgi:hypothetical protein